ncbi:expressed protein [Phakopsora pachyrhizi]|uniref:Expressed protein n=1 Tax=Phakopsora pachyrhizi TaxID=170000 RepID=A0AAV0B1T8_PHAPC|nr:expressed protein [Phakopsora pachyrhizi]
MQTIGGHPAAYPSGYSTQGYGYQNSQNILSQPPIFNYNSGSSSVQNPSQYVPTPFQSTGLHGHYSGYDPSHYMTAPLQQQEFQYHPIDSNSYKAVNLHPPRYQGISSSAAHPHRHVSKKWRTRSPPVWDVYPVKSVERVFYYDFRNTDMKNDPAQFNSEKESGYTDASSSSHSSLNGSSNSDMNRKYTNVFNNFRSKDEEKAILKKEDQKNQLENNEKDFSVVNNPAPEDNLNYNSNNIMGGNHAKMVLDKEKNLERVAVNKPDLENFSKSSSNVEISSSSSIESEFDSQKEADKAEDHQKPEVKQSSQGGLYLPRYSRKKKPIKNSFYGYESSRQNGWKSHYKITKNLGFKTKYIPKNKHLDKKDELMLNDIHYENQNNGSKDDKISKLTTDYDSEKTLKLKEILGLENRQVSKESKDLLEDENTFINNSEGKRRKNTFITSLEDLKAHHNAGETSTNKMKQSDPQGTLEKNREPSTESKELFNKKSKEDEKIQIESTSTSDDKILPMMADSQLDPTKNQKTEHDMNQEKNFNRQDQKLAEEGEKKLKYHFLKNQN